MAGQPPLEPLEPFGFTDPNLELISTHLFSTGLDQPPTTSKSASSNTTAPLPHIHLLQYGVDRLLSAASAFNWPAVTANLSQPNRATSLAQEVQTHIVQARGESALDPNKRFIVRIAFKHDGVLRLMSGPRPHVPGVAYYPLTPPPPPGPSADSPRGDDDVLPPVIPIHLDPGTTPQSLFTTHKTSFRDHYNAARARVGFDDSVTLAQGEMLLQNEGAEIMGGGVTSVYLWRDGRWVTPAEQTGCKMGVSRRWAVEEMGTREEVVLAGDVKEGKEVWVSSAVGGWRRGRVTLMSRGSD